MSERKTPAGGGKQPGTKDGSKASAQRGRSTASRRRKNLSGDSGGRQISRPLLVALLVIIAGGSYLFWPRGGDVPLGIGEQYSVVTADSTQVTQPRSGSVDLDGTQQDLVPEAPDGQSEPVRKPVEVTAEEPAAASNEDPPAEKPAAEVAAPPKPAPKKTEPAQPVEKPEPITPKPRGPWAVQLGAFKTEANAERSVQSLADKGVQAHVRTASTSSGDLIYRVWVGWFDSRAEALAYAKQEKRRIGDAYPVHR
jgi:cell division septation protein DedD